MGRIILKVYLIGWTKSKTFPVLTVFSGQVSALGNYFLPVIPLLLNIARRWTVRNICSYTFNWVVPFFTFIQADTLASISSFILFNCSI